MTNTPGWASPGSSDSTEPDDGDSSGSATPPQDAPASQEPAPPPGGWSSRQPPPGQWQHAPSDSSGPTAHGPAGPPPGPAGPTGGPQGPSGNGWGQWAPPPPPSGGPRWGSTAPGGWQQQGQWSRPPAPKPGVIPLRPLGGGEILDGALATLRLHWRAILAVTFAVALFTQSISVVIEGLFVDDTRLDNLKDNPDPSVGDIMHALRGALAGSGLTVLVVLVGVLIATAMLTMVTSRAVLGRPVTIAEAWRDARPRLPHLLGLTLLIPAALCGILALAVLPGVLIALAGSEDGGGALAFLGLVGGAGVVIWLAVLWSLASPALMLEKQGVIAAMKRSVKLVRGTWWRVLGVQLLAIVLVYIASSIIQLPFVLIAGGVTGESIGSFVSSDGSPGWTFLVITGIGAVIGSTITLPITSGVTSLLYMDQRIRREALDIELTRAASSN